LAPPLIALLGDAQQVAVLLLLVLQLSFLIPPMGYAVMMARSRSGLVNTSVGQTLRALLPYILAQCTVTTLVFLMPLTVHQLDAAPDAVLAPVSAEDLDQQMRDMATKE
jgi:TRAP-type mannitol/chloroaromatic compound transport system permease large subunit